MTFSEPHYPKLCGRTWSVVAQAHNGVGWSTNSAAKSIHLPLCLLV